MTNLAALAAPARRALAAAGLTSLEAIARAERTAIAELHGMGPYAIAVLDDAIQQGAIGG